MASISPAVLVLLFLILFTILFFIIFGLMQLFQRRRGAPVNSQVALSAESPQSPSTKFCTKCGTKIPGIADYCPECGNRQ